MSPDVRESIAANLEKRAAEYRARPYWMRHATADWLDELAAEVRAGVL